MEPAESNQSGLPAHLMQQLQQASQQVSQANQAQNLGFSRGRQRGRQRGGQRGAGQRGMSRGQPNISHPSQVSRQTNLAHPSQDPRLQPRSGHSHSNAPQPTSQASSVIAHRPGFHQNTAAPQAGSEDDFPVLGSTRSSKSSRSSSTVPSQPPELSNMNQQRAQAFQQRVRDGVYRGHNSFPHQNPQGRPQQQRFVQPSQYQIQQFQVDDFRRPPPQHQAVYNPMVASVANQRHALRKRILIQNEYLETIAGEALKNQMPVEEQQEKEALRQTLERIMHDVITDYGRTHMAVEASKVKLKCYGSLASGFAVAGSDMDLLVTFPRDGKPAGSLEEDIKRLFEKALLDAGFGARLLTQTRVPIMRVCETPTPKILDGLRRYRAKWEQDEQDEADLKDSKFESIRLPVVTREEIEAVFDMFAELGNEPGETPLPPSPGRELPHLEYTKDCGIQCDINFSNYVALNNTRLLRTYCLHDERVRRMGLIVKAWAKARKINTPYHGTLSSYGYILMLLHFLMNVASPPLIPNLQIMAKDQDAWSNRTDFETVDGFDVRFMGDHEQIAAAIEGRPRNQETLGSLLRGFFWYYSDQQGFHWTNDIISIRSLGGSLTKRSKDWTEAKWTGAKNTIRNRYLLCIEDPFEIEHNVARTVCHSGIVAIRDEFRRARKIIERIEKVPNVGWQWFEDNTEPGQDFMAAAEDRGDLLRKDYDFHKLKRLRAEAEATERSLKEANALVDLEDSADASKQDGTSSQHSSYGDLPLEAEPPGRKLTQFVGQQQANSSPQRGRLRQVKPDSDDEEDDEILTEHRELHALSKDIPENKGLSRRLCASSSESEKLDGSESDFCSGSGFVPRTVDMFGKLLPWDLATQEGRWLHWRDGKVRNGFYKGILSPGLRALNEQCPFDPSRPCAIPLSGHADPSLIKPPFPMSTFIDEEVLVLDEDPLVENDHTVLATPTGAIGWDMSISDCRWLNKRDELMRGGNFSRPNDPATRALDAEFPYVEQTPPDEQIRRNEVLRERHKRWVSGEISQLEKDKLRVSTHITQDEPQVEQNEGTGWDISTADGRWLRNRDELVRTGLFNRHQYQPRTLKLHDQFPYNASTRPVFQRKRNFELRLWGIERLMAEIPEDVHHALDTEMHQDSDSYHQVPADSVSGETEKAAIIESLVTNNNSTAPVIEVGRNQENEATWDVFNRTGKWLNERDAAMRAGMWTHGRLAGWQIKTNKMFPFLPDPTPEERNERNELLKTWGGQGVFLGSKYAASTDATRPSWTVSKDTGSREESQESLLVSFSADGLDSEPETKDQSWMKIQWDSSTRQGRWLRWRDKQIKQGKTKGTVDRRFRHLDEMFPYIANPSLDEQTDRNKELLAMHNGLESTRSGQTTNESQAVAKEHQVKAHQSIEVEACAATDSPPREIQNGSNSTQRLLLSNMTWEGSLLGSWFAWRDSKIRKGKWENRKDHKFLSWLESTLPYIAQPTSTQQKHLNEQLRAITAENPRLKPFEGLRHAERERPTAEDMIHLLSLEKQQSIPPSQTAQIVALVPLSNKPAASQTDYSRNEGDFIRNQRLHYFASQFATTQDTRSENQNLNTTQGPVEKTDLPLTPPSTHTSTCAAPTASSSASASLNCNPDKTSAPNLVAQTLHKGSLDSCPRDEDPAIMPIPSMPAFAFDASQLRDLNIIEQGGNGCARFGEEWNIEPDGEWGGGGWMGHKISENEEPDAEEKKEEWKGKGDEDGLLGELPCL